MAESAGGRSHTTQFVPDFVEPSRDLVVQTVRGWGFQSAFGFRAAIPVNTSADVWSGTAATRPLPLAPTLMSLVSTSASDLTGVSGAQLVGLTFIDGNGDWRVSDFITLDGITPVPITYKPGSRLVTEGEPFSLPDGTSVAAPIFRVQDAGVFVALGATEAAPRASNIGELLIVDTATATIEYDHIPSGRGRTSTAAFHCPRGYTGKITKIPVGSPDGQGTFRIATTFGPGTAFQTLPLTTVSSSSVVFENDGACTPLLAQSDVQVLVEVSSNNTDATAVIQLRLEPD